MVKQFQCFLLRQWQHFIPCITVLPHFRQTNHRVWKCINLCLFHHREVIVNLLCYFCFHINNLICIKIVTNIKMIFLKFSRFIITKLCSPCTLAFQVCLYAEFIILIHVSKCSHKLLRIHSTDIYKAELRQIFILYQQDTLFTLFLFHLTI